MIPFKTCSDTELAGIQGYNEKSRNHSLGKWSMEIRSLFWKPHQSRSAGKSNIFKVIVLKITRYLVAWHWTCRQHIGEFSPGKTKQPQWKKITDTNSWGDSKKWLAQSSPSKAHIHRISNWLFIISYIKDYQTFGGSQQCKRAKQNRKKEKNKKTT